MEFAGLKGSQNIFVDLVEGWMRDLKLIVAVTMVLICLSVSGSAIAQKGAAKATWNPPKTTDGQPDIQGYGGTAPGAAKGVGAAQYDIEEGYPAQERALQSRVDAGSPDPRPNVIVNPVDGKVPYQSWAIPIRDENRINALNPTELEHIDSLSRCLQMGVPRQNFLGAFQVLQVPGYVIMLHGNGLSRTIPVDGRAHINGDIKLWAGDSVGHWERNTLVVDVTNINEYAFYDVMGNFHSSDLHLVERWTTLDSDTIEYEVTNDDPKVFTRPWTMKNMYARNKKKDDEIFENACYEGEKDVEVMLHHSDSTGNPK
jgi:hypothetical protein